MIFFMFISPLNINLDLAFLQYRLGKFIFILFICVQKQKQLPMQPIVNGNCV